MNPPGNPDQGLGASLRDRVLVNGAASVSALSGFAPLRGARGPTRIPIPTEAVEAYLAGACYSDAARRFGVVPETLRRHLKRHGLMNRRRTKYPAPDAAVADCAAGAAVRDAAKKHSVSAERLARSLAEMGIKVVRRTIPRDTKREARCIRLYRWGFTLRDIGLEFGVSFQRIQQILIRAGEPMRSRGYRRED